MTQCYVLYFFIKCRAWFLLFDMRFAEAVQNCQWWSKLNHHARESSFWISHKHSYGNLGKMSKYFILLWIIWTSVTCAVFIQTNNNIKFASLVFHGLSVLSIICFIAIWCKLPQSIYDEFSIRKEMGYYICVYSIILIFYFYVAVTDELYNNIGWNIGTIVNILCTVSTGYFMALYPIHRCTHIQTYVSQQNKNGNSGNSGNSSREGTPVGRPTRTRVGRARSNSDSGHGLGVLVFDSSNSNYNQIVHKKWYYFVGESTENFNHFANHLVREFCIEHLLFVCEAIQWKQLIIDHITVMKKRQSKTSGMISAKNNDAANISMYNNNNNNGDNNNSGKRPSQIARLLQPIKNMTLSSSPSSSSRAHDKSDSFNISSINMSNVDGGLPDTNTNQHQRNVSINLDDLDDTKEKEKEKEKRVGFNLNSNTSSNENTAHNYTAVDQFSPPKLQLTRTVSNSSDGGG